MMENLIEDVLTALLAGKPVKTDSERAVLVPSGFRVEDLEQFKDQPDRVKGHIELYEVQSFLRYVEKFSSASTVVLADLKRQRFTAVMNYHQNSTEPGWGDHKATYNCPISRQWTTWTEKNSQVMTQASFAEFIENNQLNIQQYNGEGPTSTDMLEVSRNLSAKQKVEFKSSIDLSNGDVGFEYQQTTEGVSGANKGKIEVPKEFFILVPVYEGDAAYPVRARLRYRIKDGALALWYELVEPDAVAEDAFKHTLESIESGLEGKADVYRAAAP